MGTEIETLFGRSINFKEPTLVLYVCRGARLVVCDVRFTVIYSPGAKTSEKHCRSLYQQGSVVIVKGFSQLAICTRDEQLNKKSDVKGKTGATGEASGIGMIVQPPPPVQTGTKDETVIQERDYTLSYTELLEEDYYHNLYVEPRERGVRQRDGVENYLDGDNGRRACDFRDKVIFLGAVESQGNSICWYLNVKPDQNNPKHSYNQLRIPEGGIIEDVAPLSTGLRLIQHRHRYERLWEDVVVDTTGTTATQRFTVPNDGYYLRRMLGINNQGEGWGRMCIELPYDKLWMPQDYINLYTNPADNDIRRYIRYEGERYIDAWRVPNWLEWNDHANYRPFAPPFYPLIVSRNPTRFEYIGYDKKVTKEGSDRWKVERRDNLYRIGYDVVAETKAWDHIGIVSDQRFDRLSTFQKRFSEDVVKWGHKDIAFELNTKVLYLEDTEEFCGSSSDDAIHYKWREAFDFYPYITTEHDVSSAAVYEAHVTLKDGKPSHVPDIFYSCCNTRHQEVPGHFVRVPVLLQLYRDPASPPVSSRSMGVCIAPDRKIILWSNRFDHNVISQFGAIQSTPN